MTDHFDIFSGSMYDRSIMYNRGSHINNILYLRIGNSFVPFSDILILGKNLFLDYLYFVQKLLCNCKACFHHSRIVFQAVTLSNFGVGDVHNLFCIIISRICEQNQRASILLVMETL